MQAELPNVRMLSVGQPNYGLAMKTGILDARGTFVICDEIDLLDTEFYARAMALLERSDTDLIVGSKAMVGSNDQRPVAGPGQRRPGQPSPRAGAGRHPRRRLRADHSGNRHGAQER